MLLKTKIRKNFIIKKKEKITSQKFLEKFILPFEKNNKKENISEKMNDYLVKIR